MKVAPLGHAATPLIAVSGALVVLALAVTALVVVLAAGVLLSRARRRARRRRLIEQRLREGPASREPDRGDEGREIREE